LLILRGAKDREEYQKIIETYQQLLQVHSKNDTLDELRKRFGERKLGFPRGFIYKIIKKEDIFDAASYLKSLNSDIRDIMRRIIIFAGIPESEADVKNFWRLPKLPSDLKKLSRDLKGRIENEYGKLRGEGKWVRLTKGSSQEWLWWKPESNFINWSRESVKALSSLPMARWQGYEYFFREGVFAAGMGNMLPRYVNIPKSITDHSGYGLFPYIIIETLISSKYCIGIGNSTLGNYLTLEFLNHTVNSELNDLRLLPIVIPTESQRKQVEVLIDKAIQIQKRRYATKDEEEKTNLWENLQKIQKEIDKKVEEIYGMK